MCYFISNKQIKGLMGIFNFGHHDHAHHNLVNIILCINYFLNQNDVVGLLPNPIPKKILFEFFRHVDVAAEQSEFEYEVVTKIIHIKLQLDRNIR